MKPKTSKRFYTFKSLLFIPIMIRKFWTMVWNDFITNRLFKIVLARHSFDFFNVQNGIVLMKWNVVYETFFFKPSVFPSHHIEIALTPGLWTQITDYEIIWHLTVSLCSRAPFKLLKVIWKNMSPQGRIFGVCTSRHNNWKIALVRAKFAYW